MSPTSITSTNATDPASCMMAGSPFETVKSSVKGIFGDTPKLEVLLKEEEPLFHEAGVFLADENALFVTSNYIEAADGSKIIKISRVTLPSGEAAAKLEPVHTPNVTLANGGVNYKDGIVFCAQGNKERAGGLALMQTTPVDGYDYESIMLLEGFGTDDFNSPNDVVPHKNGSLWFTDPIYGSEQGIRPEPTLAQQVWRFDPATKEVRAMAEGFGRPNGLAFSPDQKTLYVTDTDKVHGDGTEDASRASDIIAFTVETVNGETTLTNRRRFATVDEGIPDGIKCDTNGNVYSGYGDGVQIWSPQGELLGKIKVEGGAANFCFGSEGRMYILNEKQLYVAQLSPEVKGALLN